MEQNADQHISITQDFYPDSVCHQQQGYIPSHTVVIKTLRVQPPANGAFVPVISMWHSLPGGGHLTVPGRVDLPA